MKGIILAGGSLGDYTHGQWARVRSSCPYMINQ